MSKLLNILLSLSILLLIANTTKAADSEFIRVSGASSLGAVSQPIAKKFDQETGIRVQVSDSGSGGGLKCILKSECEVGLITGKINPEEAAKIKVYEVGWDGIAVLANKSSGVSALTSAQVAGVFSGKYKNWKEVGGPDLAMEVLTRDPSRSTAKQMEDHFKIKLAGKEITGPHSAVINHLKAFKGSIGFTTLGGDRGSDPPNLISIDGISPTIENVRSGKYALIRPMNIVTAQKPSPKTERFINFLLKAIPEGLSKDGYIPSK